MMIFNIFKRTSLCLAQILLCSQVFAHTSTTPLKVAHRTPALEKQVLAPPSFLPLPEAPQPPQAAQAFLVVNSQWKPSQEAASDPAADALSRDEDEATALGFQIKVKEGCQDVARKYLKRLRSAHVAFTAVLLAMIVTVVYNWVWLPSWAQVIGSDINFLLSTFGLVIVALGLQWASVHLLSWLCLPTVSDNGAVSQSAWTQDTRTAVQTHYQQEFRARAWMAPVMLGLVLVALAAFSFIPQAAPWLLSRWTFVVLMVGTCLGLAIDGALRPDYFSTADPAGRPTAQSSLPRPSLVELVAFQLVWNASTQQFDLTCEEGSESSAWLRIQDANIALNQMQGVDDASTPFVQTLNQLLLTHSLTSLQFTVGRDTTLPRNLFDINPSTQTILLHPALLTAMGSLESNQSHKLWQFIVDLAVRLLTETEVSLEQSFSAVLKEFIKRDDGVDSGTFCIDPNLIAAFQYLEQEGVLLNNLAKTGEGPDFNSMSSALQSVTQLPTGEDWQDAFNRHIGALLQAQQSA